MTIETITEHGEPDPERADPALRTPADAAQEAQAAPNRPPTPRCTPTRPTRSRASCRSSRPWPRRSRTPCAPASTCGNWPARRCRRSEGGGRRTARVQPGRQARSRRPPDPAASALGLAIVVALVILDAVPLNWAAQAFGLDSDGTWLVTFILVVASVGAMLGFELTRGHPRRRGVLTAVVTVGYLALLGLRTEFLITVSGDSFPVAVLQSTLLTAISAGLVLCGSAVLARTRSVLHSRARAAARRAAQAADDARSAHAEAADKLERHIGSLHQMLLPWALRSAAPEGVDHAKWAAALEQAIRALFSLT